MNIEKYPDFESTTRAVTSPERKYVFERHELVAGENIPWHFHPKAEEVIIIHEGALWLAVEKERKIIRRKKGSEIKVARIYPGEAHALMAFSDISYSVYKTREDKITLCKGPNLKAELKKMMPVIRQIAKGNLQKGG
jgi:quercetin dioxygenase-like cupin family protein